MTHLVKNPPDSAGEAGEAGDVGLIPGREDPLEQEVATPSSGRVACWDAVRGLQRVRHD